MSEIRHPECTDCPLLDKVIEHGCPHDSTEPHVHNRIQTVFPPGEHLFEQGNPIAGIHCVHSGKAALVKHTASDRWVLAVVTPGDVLGMPDILGEEYHRNGAVALQETCACFIPKEEALELFTTNPSILLRIMRKVCERIRSMEQQIEHYFNEDLNGEHP